MKTITCTALAAALVLTLPACNREPATGNEAAATEAAASDLTALNATWKADLKTLKFEQKPDEFLVQDGTYKCNTCIPPLTTAADGQFHPVADRPYYDSMSVKVVDDRTIEIHRKKGDKEASSVTMQVSADGNTLTNKFHDATVTPAIDGTGIEKRAGAAPAGAHAVSGQWMPDQIPQYSEEALNTTYRIDGNTVNYSSQGQSYTAELGGPPVAVQGDMAGTMVAVTREGANGLRETYTRDGKEVSITTTVPSADGKSVSVTFTDPRDGSKGSFTANKS
jgi:hypothetical protein